MQIITVIWGEEGKGKTSMGLTFPKPLKHYDLDVGGYERASWRVHGEGITSTSYPTPVQMERLMGVQNTGTTIHLPRRVVGYKELWQRIVVDFINDCQDPEIKTIMIDSATQLWKICHTSLLQEKQEIQINNKVSVDDEKFRTRLQSIEYPNDKMNSLVHAAKGSGKNLVLTHYPRNVYREKFDNMGKLVSYKSDDVEPDGFKGTVRVMSIVFWAYADKGIPRAQISLKSALPYLGMDAIGLELPEPTYDGILQLQAMRKGDVVDDL